MIILDVINSEPTKYDIRVKSIFGIRLKGLVLTLALNMCVSLGFA